MFTGFLLALVILLFLVCIDFLCVIRRRTTNTAETEQRLLQDVDSIKAALGGGVIKAAMSPVVQEIRDAVAQSEQLKNLQEQCAKKDAQIAALVKELGLVTDNAKSWGEEADRLKRIIDSTPITFQHYSARAATTAVYADDDAFLYPIFAAAGELGEIINIYKKLVRAHGAAFARHHIDVEKRAKLAEELGDVLWYLSAAARDLDVPLSDIATSNLEKLAMRAGAGQIVDR